MCDAPPTVLGVCWRGKEHLTGRERAGERKKCIFKHISLKLHSFFFLPSELPTAHKHVGDVLVLKAMAHSFPELFWEISQSALDIPETTDNCDRKLQGRLTYSSLLTGRSFPVPSYSWNHRAWVTCPNPQSLLTLLQSKHKFQFAFNSLFAHLPHQYFASLVLCHDVQEQYRDEPTRNLLCCTFKLERETFQHTKGVVPLFRKISLI